MSNILNTPHRTTTTDPKLINTPYSGFDRLTLNSNTTNNNSRTKRIAVFQRPTSFNDRLDNVKKGKDEDDTEHPNTFMVFKDNKITMMDSPMNNEREGINYLFGSDDDNDISEDDETNTYSPGRLSVSPDRGFPPQNQLFEDDDNHHEDKEVDVKPNERMIDDDIFGSAPITKKQQHKEKPDDVFGSVSIKEKALFKDDVEKIKEKPDDIFGSTSITKVYSKKDPYLDTSSSWLDDIYVPPKSSKHKNKNKSTLYKSTKSIKSNNNLQSLASSSSSSLSAASTSSSSSSLSSLSSSPSTSSSTSSSPSSPSINNQRRNSNIKPTGKENDAPSRWLQLFGDSKSKYTKTPKETDTNNHTTNYTGPLCEISVAIKPEALTTSTSNSSTDSDDLHVRKKKVLNVNPKRVRFMRSLSPIRSDYEPRKGKELNPHQEEHHIQNIR